MSAEREIFISVDVETSGPIPGEFSLLSIGACRIDDPDQSFFCTVKPINHNADKNALEVSGFSLEALEKSGLPPKEAMFRFEKWVTELVRERERPIFVGLNAPFDWSFVNYYFHRFLGQNPFGFTALDIKAYYMGATGCNWDDTRSSKIAQALKPKLSGDHNALRDAQYQAELFRLVKRRQR